MTRITPIRNFGARRKALEAFLRETLASNRREELTIEHAADPVDEVRGSIEREMAGQRLEQRANRARDIRAALGRIEDGTFGLCERCEEPIGAKRLDAVPWARLCVACQAEAEREEAAGAVSVGRAA